MNVIREIAFLIAWRPPAPKNTMVIMTCVSQRDLDSVEVSMSSPGFPLSRIQAEFYLPPTATDS